MILCKKILTFDLPDGKVLLVNSLSGAVDLVNKDVAANLIAGSLSPQEQVQWKKRGYLLDGSADEETIQSQIVNACQIALARSPVLAVVMPSYRCNLRCTYCYEGMFVENNIDMALEAITPLFTAIEKLAKKFAGALITLYGGEPLLESNESVIISILEKAQEHGFQVYSVITNGTTLEYSVKTLVKYGVTRVQVTIDGVEEIHNSRRPFAGGEGSFDKVVKGIDVAWEHGLKVVVRTNVDFENTNDLPALAEFYQQRELVNSAQFVPYLSIVTSPSCMGSDLCTGGNPELIGKVLRIVDDNWELFSNWKFKFDRIGHIASVLMEGRTLYPRTWYCNAGKSMFVFDPQGKIYPCWDHVGTDQEIGYYLPTLTLTELAAQWAERTINTIPECRKCSMNLLCGGGCAYRACQKHGTLQAPSCYRPEAGLKQVVPFLYERLYQGTQGNESSD